MPISDQPGLSGYTVVRSLSEGSNGSVVLASRAGSGAQVVIKLFQPSLLVDGEAERTERDRRAGAFLKSARLQQAVSSGGKRWAPIHDTGVLTDGAFYATDFYPASAEWLIRAHVSMSGPVLRSMIAGVVAALIELQSIGQRGHGNLTPSNVMLSDRNPRLANVALTDLAITFQPDSKIDAADDRWAVGALIYALVKNAPVRRMMQLPMEADSSWLALGRDGRKWLSLCNRLLAHDASARPALAEVAKELVAPAPSRAGPMIAKTALLVACLTGVTAVGLAGYSFSYAWYYNRQLQPGNLALQSLLQSRSDHDFQAAISTDPWLSARLPGLLDSIAVAREEGRHLPTFPTPAKFLEVRHVVDPFNEVNNLFAATNWPMLAKIDELRNLAHTNGWTGVEKSLSQIDDGLPPRGESGAAKKLQVFLVKAPDLLKSGEALNAAWNGFAHALGPALSSTNSSAITVATALQSRTAASLNLAVTPDLRSATLGAERLSSYLNRRDSEEAYSVLCESISAGFNGSMPTELSTPIAALKPQPKVEVARIESPKIEPVKPATIKGSRVVVEPPKVETTKPPVGTIALADTQPLVSLSNDLADAKTFIDTLEDSGSKPILTDRFDELNRSIGLMKRQWTADQSPQLNLQCDRARFTLNALWGDLHSAAVENWLTSVNNKSVVIVPENTTWHTALDELRNQASTLAADPKLFKARQESVSLWVDFLPRLDKAIREAVKLPEAYDDVLVKRRRLELWMHIPPFNLASVPPDPEALIATVPRSEWSNELARFALDFPVKRPATDLSLDDVRSRWLGEHARAEDAHFWEAEVISSSGSLHGLAWLARDISTVTALADTARMTREQLNQAIIQPGSVEVLLFARLRLDCLSGKDAWPRTARELELADRWLPQMIKASASIGMTAGDQKRLLERQRQAWFRFTDNATSTSELAQAVNHASSLGVTLDPTVKNQINLALKNDPVTSYNILVYYVQQSNGTDVSGDLLIAIAGLPPQASKKIVEQFNRVSSNVLRRDQIQSAMSGNSSSWYLWPNTEFRPVAYVPPPPAPVVTESPADNHQATVNADQPANTPSDADNSRPTAVRKKRNVQVP